MAETEGVPVYAVFTNRQLADITRHKSSGIVKPRKIDNIIENNSIQRKSRRPEVLPFRENLDINLLALRKSLPEDSFAFGRYETFTIRDPKERSTCA